MIRTIASRIGYGFRDFTRNLSNGRKILITPLSAGIGRVEQADDITLPVIGDAGVTTGA